MTGGTGFIGAHVVRALLARGTTVRCLVRPSSRLDNLRDLDVELVAGDLLDPASLARAARGCESVFHCAADYRLWARDPEAIHRSNVVGTRNVLAAAAEAGVTRVVYTSSVSALGLVAGEGAADEDTPVREEHLVGPYKRSKFLAQREAEEAARGGLHVVIVNPSTPVGEGDVKPTPTGRVIVDFLRGRMPAYVDSGLNLIDVRDVAEGHVLAAERGRSGERYILGNRNVSLRQLLDMLALIAGRPAPRVRLPHWIPLLAAHASEAWSRVVGGEPRVGVDAVRMSRQRMFFDASKAVRELGLPQSPVEGALARAVEWFRVHGYAP
ncbi:MAG: hopanoid-associated sugar epimerase [Gemmatimonadota bacterium]